MGRDGFDIQRFARDINELLVLSALRSGPKHGYQIGLDIDDGSTGLFQFRHGTLYPILHRLEKEGLIRGSWSKEGGRRRRVYELTSQGSDRLEGGTQEVDEISSSILRVLRLGAST